MKHTIHETYLKVESLLKGETTFPVAVCLELASKSLAYRTWFHFEVSSLNISAKCRQWRFLSYLDRFIKTMHEIQKIFRYLKKEQYCALSQMKIYKSAKFCIDSVKLKCGQKLVV